MSTARTLPLGGIEIRPTQHPKFQPTPEDYATFGVWALASANLLPKPGNVPASHIAYNPSGIWTLQPGLDILYARVEPDHSGPDSSHLGHTFARPYQIDIHDPSRAPQPFFGAPEITGEDPALTRINMRLRSGKIVGAWFLSVVDAQPQRGAPNIVASLATKFYAGTDISRLEQVGEGPAWMKDIRARAVDSETTLLDLYGRPQEKSFSGNISYRRISGIEQLTPEIIGSMQYIDDGLAPAGSGIWIGVNDVFNAGPNNRILLSHRAWQTGLDGSGRHYESVLFGHDLANRRVVELGVIATANCYPNAPAKADEQVDTSDVTFPGGGYNGELAVISSGLYDSSIGLAQLRRY